MLIINIKKQTSTLISTISVTNRFISKLSKFTAHNNILLIKSAKLWFIFCLIFLLTQQLINGQEMADQMSNSKILHKNISNRVNYLQLLSQKRNIKHKYRDSADPIKRNTQPRIEIETKLSNPDKYLKTLSKKHNKELNASSSNYSLINVRQSTNISHRNNAIIPRKTRDIPKVNNKKPTKIDEIKLKRLVLNGLGMKKLPDMTKVRKPLYIYLS